VAKLLQKFGGSGVLFGHRIYLGKWWPLLRGVPHWL
jgi:hypothetical protein